MHCQLTFLKIMANGHFLKSNRKKGGRGDESIQFM